MRKIYLHFVFPGLPLSVFTLGALVTLARLPYVINEAASWLDRNVGLEFVALWGCLCAVAGPFALILAIIHLRRFRKKQLAIAEIQTQLGEN